MRGRVRRAYAYHYSSYDEETEVEPRARRRDHSASGPTGSGRASSSTTAACTPASRCEAGYETITVNSNPETVSTDYDTFDRLYFEPLTAEDVLRRAAERQRAPIAGVICQLGGQTPLGLAQGLEERASRRRHDAVEAIHLAEERGARARAGRCRAAGAQARPGTSYGGARHVAEIGYPVLVRPSYVLGGRGEIVYDDEGLEDGISARP